MPLACKLRRLAEIRFFIQSQKVVGEAPATAREARALPPKIYSPSGRNNLSGSPSDSSILSQHEDSKICCASIAGFWDHCRERRRAIEFGARSDVRQSVSRV